MKLTSEVENDQKPETTAGISLKENTKEILVFGRGAVLGSFSEAAGRLHVNSLSSFLRVEWAIDH